LGSTDGGPKDRSQHPSGWVQKVLGGIPRLAKLKAQNHKVATSGVLTKSVTGMSGQALRQFGPAIWIAEGGPVSFFGFRYPTRMAIVKLIDGGLFVWSPVALSAALKVELDALGPVQFVVSPSRLHHLFIAEWASAYPDARRYAAPGLRKKRQDLIFDGELGDAPEPEWASDIDQVSVRGSPLTEVEFFHYRSRTAIFADLIQNLPRDWFQGWRAVAARVDGICAPHPGAPREWRAMFLDRRAARASVERILAWPIERVLIAHGEPVTMEGGAFVRQAFTWLLGREHRLQRLPQ
jgi:hypothetical protein